MPTQNNEEPDFRVKEIRGHVKRLVLSGDEVVLNDKDARDNASNNDDRPRRWREPVEKKGSPPLLWFIAGMIAASLLYVVWNRQDFTWIFEASGKQCSTRSIPLGKNKDGIQVFRLEPTDC